MLHSRKCAPLILGALFAVLLVPAGTPARASVKTVDGVWSALDYSVAYPSERREHVAIYDEAHARYLLFGGFGWGSSAPENNFNEVWALSLTGPPAWTRIAVAGTPPGPRKAVQWGYDIARQRLLIFGGYGQHYVGDIVYWQNDVWQLSLDDNPTWTELFPTGTPPTGRLAGVSVYDPLRQRFVGFGGTAGAPTDTWCLDLSGDPAWLPVNTGDVQPDGGYGMASIYDPIRDRMLVFGGSVGAEYLGAQNNLWELTLGDSMVWNKLMDSNGTVVSQADTTGDTSTVVRPIPRRSMASIYDPMRDRMVIYGGWDALGNDLSSFLGDTWALSIADLQWSELLPTGTIPVGRDVTAAIYDPNGDRMVLYGGWSGNSMLGDTQYLTWGDAPTSANIAGSGSATTTSASLSWGVSQSTGVHTAVFRSSPGHPWQSIATVDAGPGGSVSYVDHAVTPGVHYSYKLAVASQRGEVVGGQVSLVIPNTTDVPPAPNAAFALNGVRPNPVADHLNVSFSLPNSDAARLEVLDVNGRRLAMQDVGGLGAGNHQLDLGSTRSFAPGMYFVRLSRTGQSLTTRAVVVGNR